MKKTKYMSARYALLGVLVIGVLLIVGTIVFMLMQRGDDDTGVAGEAAAAEKSAGAQELEAWDSQNELKNSASPQEKYDYYALRTSALSGAGKYTEATEEFKKAELTGIEVSYALYGEAAVAYQIIGNTAEARASYEKAITAAEKQLQGTSKTITVLNLQSSMERL